MTGPAAHAPPARLVHLGSVLVDIVLYVPALPGPGGDVLATDSLVTTGGGFNVLTAAARQGLPSAYAGPHGTGRFGDQVRNDLSAQSIPLLLSRTAGADTGFCVGLVDATGERTYATVQGVEGHLTESDLAAVQLRGSDAVYLSGYDLAYAHGRLVARWFADLDPATITLFDPGPLVAELPPELLDPVLHRSDWVSTNHAEATVLTGSEDPREAVRRLAGRKIGRNGGTIVRVGRDGCWLATSTPLARDELRILHIPVPGAPVVAADTSGAGDTHVGAFCAALGRGLSPIEACVWANAAAARCVATKGPATAPTLDTTRNDVAVARR